MIIFVDGYDELNESSQKLMEDVMSYQERYKGRMRVIITSRPEAAAELTKELSKRSISWQLATMAPVNDNIKYLELYEEALKKHGTGQGLVEAFRRLEESIKNILNTPVLLALFVELYIYDEKTIDTWRTEHDIMCSYIDMIRNEIVERVRKGKDDMGNPFTKPTARANAILQSVALLALKMHTHMKMHLREHDYMALNDKVNDDKKNPLNTLGEDTFKSVLSCVLTPQQAATGTERQYEFSHLSFQEVLAAKALEENLEGIDEPTTRNTLQTEHGRNSHQRSNDGTSAFKTTIKKLTGVEVTHIRRYANIVKYVMSFLKKHQKLQTHGPILAGVIREMKAGLNYSIDVIAASGNDGVVAELVTRTAEESETINKWEIIAAKHIEAATLMLRLLEQREGVELLRAELKEVLTKQHYTALEELLDLLAQKYSHVMVGITLHHSYEECVPVDGLVKKMKSLKELKWFTGCVAEEESLLALRNSRWAQGSLMHLSTKDPELKLYLLGGSDGRCGARGLWFTLHYTEEHLPARPLPVCSIGRPPYLYIKRCPKEAQEQQLIDLIVNLAPKYEDDGREYKGYWGLFLTHCGLTDESVNVVLRGLQQRHVRTYGGGNTRAERQTKDDGKCDVPSLPRHTHLDGTACWLLYSRDT